jgi:hypothetical protein
VLGAALVELAKLELDVRARAAPDDGTLGVEAGDVVDLPASGATEAEPTGLASSPPSVCCPFTLGSEHAEMAVTSTPPKQGTTPERKETFMRAE